MTKRKKNKSDNIPIGYYLVGFIDLLGQQELLRNLKALPNPDNPVEMETFRSSLKQTYGTVTAMRKCFQDFFNAYSRRDMDLMRPLTKEQRQTFQAFTSHPIKFQRFSDAVIIYLPLRTDKYKFPMRGIFGTLAAVASTFLFCLAGNHLIRGGVDIGVAMEMTKGEICGAALSRAYALESRVAQYPRIIIGHELHNYLRISAGQEPSDAYAAIAKKTADKCMELITVDVDGQLFIDHLGVGFRKHIAGHIDRNVIKKAYQNVINYSVKYQQEKNSKLAFRYAQLRNYFESRLDLWFEGEAEILNSSEQSTGIV